MTPDDFVLLLQQALPGRVQSVILFGSAAAGDFVEGVSQYDLLIVLDRIDPELLEAAGPVIRRWRREGQPLPLLFTPGSLAASADAFAIEFSDVRQWRRVLCGSDPFVDLAVDPAHVRIHLERELRGKSLALRDQYVLAAGRPRRIADLLTDSVSTFLTLFRTALRLYEPDVPSRKLEALHALGRHISFDPQPFATVEELRRGALRARDLDLRDLFVRYWRQIETITTAIDQRLHTGRTNS